MANETEPVKAAYISMAVSFFIFVGIFYLFKPNCVQIIDRHTGIDYVSWKLTLSYSATFSLVIAIATLILHSSNSERKDKTEPE